MQTQRINITLPNDLAKDLRTAIPNGQRSKFIAGAVREKIAKKGDLNQSSPFAIILPFSSLAPQLVSFELVQISRLKRIR